MLHTVSSSYRELAALVPGLQGRPPSSERKKKILLEMAERGGLKPHRSTSLGAALSNYTCKSYGSYEPVFDKKIRKLAPQWFVSPSEISDRTKRRLLSIGAKGKAKPLSRSPLGRAFYGYIRKSCNSYDPVFDNEIRRVAPHWFESQAKVKRKLLLEMARQGKPKPHRETPLGQALRNYIRNSAFLKEITRLAPQWFVSKSKVVDEKKQKLTKMATKKMPRPHQRATRLGKDLCRYTQKTSPVYDPAFDSKIRKLAPHWFVLKSEVAGQKKQKLLDMAGRKLPRPSCRTKLGRVLSNYSSKKNKSYDPVFDSKIRKLAPEWFIPISAASDNKKKLLLDMARRGDPRPKYGSHPLGMFLCHCTRKTAHAYDLDFDKNIRRIRPDWFVTPAELVNEKRELLHKMARNGKQRPNQRTPLGGLLCRYIYKGSKAYDPTFLKQIRALRPDWFKKKAL
jgi:hypothetical protein